MAIVPYTIADSKSDPVAVGGKWRTVLPTDVTAATLADLGGSMQTGTFTIAANASPRQASFNVITVPNTTFTGNRAYDVEIYDITPVGTSLIVGKVRTTITEDDAAPASYIFGPSVTSDTNNSDGTFRSIGSVKKYRIYGTLSDTPWKFFIGASQNDGTPGHVLERANANNYWLKLLAEDGTRGNDNQWTYVSNGTIGPDTPFELIHDITANSLSFKIGDLAPYVRGLTGAVGGPFFRFITGNSTTANITVEAL